MSKLDRMNLMGIRSFGPEDLDAQKIKFESPLTLIQGQNGCGKTTIIEAIKFAITGELPGGTARGQGFVYDPKLSKSFESVGQVKLRVIDGRGDQVTVFKVVRVSQKGPEKLEFKRLDSTISRRKGNEPTHASNRCADVDQEMCIVLGVSKAIINQVLFCHQEDSNWPLEESKKLKERFDEIFDAAKYNKCTEHFDKKIKVKTEQSKQMKIAVDFLHEKKTYVERKKLEMHDKMEKFEGFSKNVEEIEAKLEPINTRINELFVIEQNFAKLYTNIELKKKEFELLEKQQNDLLKNVKEFDGDDDALKLKLNQFENELNTFEGDIDVLKLRRKQFEDTERDLSKKINQQQNKLGLLQAENNRNEENTNARDELIIGIGREMELNISANEENITSTIKKLMECFESNKKQVNIEEERMNKEEEEMQMEIDIAREQNAQLEQKIKSKKKQLDEHEDELKTIKNKLEELNTADDQLKLSENKLQRLEREIKSLEATVDTDQLKQQIEKDKMKVKGLQDRHEIVENEIRELQQYTNIQTELDVKNENLLSKQNDLKKLMNKHEKSFIFVFNQNVPKTDLKTCLESHIQKKQRELKNMEKEINMNQENVHKFQNILSSSKEKLKERQDELKENLKKLEEVCDGKILDDILEQTSNKLKHLHDKRGSLASSTFLYKNFIKNFQEDKPCCPLCKRNVEEEKAVEQIIQDIRKQIENIPNELEQLDKIINVERRWHEKLISLQPLNEKNKKLQEEIPQLEAQMEKHKTQHWKYFEALNKLKANISDVEKNVDTSNRISGDVSLIDQCQKEMAQLKQQISVLERSMPSSSDMYETGKRGIDEAMTERENLNLEIRSTQSNIESLQTKICQHTDRLHVRREQKNQILSQQLTIKKNLQDKDHLVTKSIEIEDKVLVLGANIAELVERVEPTKQELNNFIKCKNELRVKHQKQTDVLNTKLNKYQKKLDQITSLQTEIKRFQSRNVIDQMEAALKEISNYKTDIEEYELKRNQIDGSIEELKRKVSNGQMYYRELQDNIQLRETRSKALKLRKDIETEERNLGENDIRQIRKEKSQLIDECDNLVNQKHRKEGEKNQLKENINEIKKELALPENVKAADTYRRKHMAQLLLDCIIEDLREFSKAMRWSMLQYHKKRMVQVNSIIKELWRSIYKGNDIDYIEIKTDDVTSSTKDKRKVYVYKVVQVKNEVELEMRGRCSAGQRVLASLIIRIALAETFSNNCGILALDEPTTNLDRENINSLADALMELIQQKRQQKHFQMLIITHDQEFVDRLTQMESLDKYYEIKRNPVGKSVITVHNRY